MSYWFRHDGNAHMNERILKLQAKYDWEGYGMFWFVMEQLFNNNGSLDADAMQLLCKRSGISDDFVSSCVSIGLLKCEDGVYHSERLDEEITNRDRKSQIAKDSAMARWNKPEMRTHSERNATKEKTREENNTVVEKSLSRWLKQQGKGKGYETWLVKKYGETVNVAWQRVLAGHRIGAASDLVELCKTLAPEKDSG